MFVVDDVLRTFATEVIDSLDAPFEVEAIGLADHRIEYLDYEGEISGRRGQVRRLIGGSYIPNRMNDREFSAQLTWTTDQGEQSAKVAFYRSFDDSPDRWSLRFTP
jgi:hypothetical protein